ncbi:MAG: hypothetical protein ACYCQM_10170 [Acidithiobacillus sp.]
MDAKTVALLASLTGMAFSAPSIAAKVPMCPMAQTCSTNARMVRWYRCNAALQYQHGFSTATCRNNMHFLGANPTEIASDCHAPRSVEAQQKSCIATMRAADVPAAILSHDCRQ